MTNDNNIKNILLVGATGSGMSTLGNVLINKNNNFEEVFEAGIRMTSITSEVQTAEFEENGIRYRIIDTPGYFCTELTQEEWSEKVRKTFSVPEGINQILFVFSSGFFGGQIELYDWLKQLNKDIGRCVTMVATKFEDFKDQEACRKEYEDLRDETKIKAEIASIFREVRGLIMVDNSPVSKKRKEKSRERLINHLAAYQNNLNFKLINTQADKELTDKNKSSNKTFSTLFLIIALIIGLSGIFFFWQRKNKKSKSLNRQVVR